MQDGFQQEVLLFNEWLVLPLDSYFDFVECDDKTRTVQFEIFSRQAGQNKERNSIRQPQTLDNSRRRVRRVEKRKRLLRLYRPEGHYNRRNRNQKHGNHARNIVREH